MLPWGAIRNISTEESAEVLQVTRYISDVVC